jgi:hypothetical protein
MDMTTTTRHRRSSTCPAWADPRGGEEDTVFELRRLPFALLPAAVAVSALALGTGTAYADGPHLSAHPSGDRTVVVEGHGYPRGEQVSIHICAHSDHLFCRDMVGFELVRASGGGDFSVHVKTDCSNDDTLYVFAFENNTDIQKTTTSNPCHS